MRHVIDQRAARRRAKIQILAVIAPHGKPPSPRVRDEMRGAITVGTTRTPRAMSGKPSSA